ncbi:RTA1 like protein-domain-containing protein [Tribonema minus]|uniref:RTA1 like protein-domain-containing protein n=1 Tax=Tribonema minus TaxID=303371 RepID=A0A836CMW5_9STRA|nr:RTA1 like protein-domain-containing protein [Tribonema minus]
MGGDCSAQIEAFFRFCPEVAPAVAGLVVYLILALVSGVVSFRSRAWFTLLTPITAACEAAGFAARISFLNAPEYGAYVVMALFLIVTPTLLAVVAYIVVGRLLAMQGAERVGCIKSSSLVRMFTTSDAITLFIQMSGGGLMAAKDRDMATMGESIMLAGLLLQLCFFATFTVVAAHVHANAAKFGLKGQPGVRRLFASLYACIALLTLRNTFRVIEFSQGFDGYLATHEMYFYVLDLVPVSLAVATLTVLHPGVLLAKIAGAQGITAAGNKVAVAAVPEDVEGGAAQLVANMVTVTGTRGSSRDNTP